MENSLLSGKPANTSTGFNVSSGKLVTPQKSLKSRLKTPSKRGTPSRHRLANRTISPPTPHGADRFIPDRTNVDFERSHYLMSHSSAETDKATVMSELNGDLSRYRIITYNNKAPLAPEGHSNNLRVVYSACKNPSSKKSCRHIPTQPERILDAPDIKNDYYLQLIDWSSRNMLAVALNNEVYLWNALTGTIDNLLTVEEPDYVSSLSWAASGAHLAVGLSHGHTQIWDVARKSRLRNLNCSQMRVSCTDWNSYILSCGSKDGNIYNHDVRVGSSLVGSLCEHTQEICGLKWSPNGRMLASGANDNLVNVWSHSAMGSSAETSSPLVSLSDHQAAVKAIGWCPWRTNCLATGGGTADRMIRIWNTQNGQCVYSVDTKSQVSSILWSAEYKELISSHGYVNNELIIWKYPTLEKISELTGHTARILGMSMSPDGTTVVSLGADETLRFWECFQVDSNAKKGRNKQSSLLETKQPFNMQFNMR